MNTKNLTTTGLLIAIIFVSMLFINIRLFNSTLHIGVNVIVIICLIFERKQAIFATCIGSIIYDIASGLAVYLPFTIIARFLMAYIISCAKDKSIAIQVLYTVVASVVVVVVYFISFVIFWNDYVAAFYSSLADTIQIIFNVVAVFIAIQLRKYLRVLN